MTEVYTTQQDGRTIRCDKPTRNVTALTADESDPVLAVCFEAGLTPERRNAIMRQIIEIQGVAVVETLGHYCSVRGARILDATVGVPS